MSEIILTESFDYWYLSRDANGNLALEIPYESGLELKIYVKERNLVKLGKDFPEVLFGKEWKELEKKLNEPTN